MQTKTDLHALHLRLVDASTNMLKELQAKAAHRPLHPPLVAAGAILLISAFACDLIYWWTLLFQWNNFSIWLLAAGLVVAAIAGIALLVDSLQKRIEGVSWPRFSGFTAAALLGLLNACVHSRDAYSAVVPDGLRLSALVTVILIVLGWRGFGLAAVHSTNPSNSGKPRS